MTEQTPTLREDLEFLADQCRIRDEFHEYDRQDAAFGRLKNAVSILETAARAVPHLPMTQAAQDVLAERRRQVEGEGWTPAHDDRHRIGDLADAAACYALAGAGWTMFGDAIDTIQLGGMKVWPWSLEWWKPSTDADESAARRRNLIKAGALILAEIERIDRKAGR